MTQQINPRLIQPAMREACSVLDILLHAGFSAFFVGGAVRDTLLGKPIHDIDIATSARPEQVLELFPRSIPTGLQHGTVTVVHEHNSYEVTTFRTESSYSDYRHPGQIAFVDELEQDLQRRDFTINAMAIDRHWKLYDPYGGQSDLHNRILATVGSSSQRFQEDALRMLRALRFAAAYRLRIDEQCQQAIWQHGELLQHIAMERVAYELGRLLQADELHPNLHMLKESRLLHFTKEKLLLANGSLRQLPSIASRAESTCWALLFLHFGLSSGQAAHDMRRLRLSKRLQGDAGTLLKLCEWLQQAVEETDAAAQTNNRPGLADELKQQWLQLLLQYPLELLELWLEQFQPFSTQVKLLQQLHESLPVKSVKQLAVQGKQLLDWSNKPAGPWLKALLEQLFIAVASGKLGNNKQEIERFVKAQNEDDAINE